MGCVVPNQAQLFCRYRKRLFFSFFLFHYFLNCGFETDSKDSEECITHKPNAHPKTLMLDKNVPP